MTWYRHRYPGMSFRKHSTNYFYGSKRMIWQLIRTKQEDGRCTATETITCEGVALTAVSRFKYLGTTFQPTGTTFILHMKDRLAAAALAINDIQHLSKLSLQTAMALFTVKVQPGISYGLHHIWEHLSTSNLQCIEKN